MILNSYLPPCKNLNSPFTYCEPQLKLFWTSINQYLSEIGGKSCHHREWIKSYKTTTSEETNQDGRTWPGF